MKQDKLTIDELKVTKPNGYKGEFFQADFKLFGDEAQVRENYGCRFFRANRPFEVTLIGLITSSASSATSTLAVKKVSDGRTIGGSETILETNLNLVATKDVFQKALLSESRSSLYVDTNDCLACEPTGDISGMRDLLLSVYLKAI